MVRVEFTTEEVSELVRVLEQYLGDLRAEISDTDSSFFKEELREEKGVLNQALAKLNSQRQTEKKNPIQVRIGINSGNVIQGEIGTTERKDLTVIGDVVNTASRIQGAGVPGTVSISEATLARLKSPDTFQFFKKITLKGKTEPVRIFKLVTEPANS